MPDVDNELVQQRLRSVMEVLEAEAGSLDPEDVLSIFNEFGLFVVEAESAWPDMERG